MEKIDYKKELKHLYVPSNKQVALVEVPPMNYAMIDGAGDPNDNQWFQDAMQALYGISYTLKFDVKKEQGIDYTVMASEGLWWTNPPEAFSMDNRDEWHWTLMIMQPPFITEEMFRGASQSVITKKGVQAAEKARLETMEEGLSVQVMHIGPYSEEPPTIKRMFDFMDENGYKPRGKHHEIYLSDPRRVAPEKMKTVLRHPVEPVP